MSKLFTISTAGSVDDGKSTLLGRLVHDAQGLLSDSAAALTQGERIDFSRLTDGLVAEREQGITIDVAWRHLAVGSRRYLLADAPGHEQYTRNLVTAASHADALIVLIDPTRLDLGVAHPALLAQTHRHVAIAHFLRVPCVAFVINKLDLFDKAEQVAQQVCASLQALMDEVGLAQSCRDVQIIAASALTGENIAVRGERLAWYRGPTVLEWLERIAADVQKPASDAAWAVLPVQTALRSQGSDLTPFRGLAGKLSQGRLQVNQSVTALPSLRQARIVSIWRHGQEVQEAHACESITLVLDRDLDISRGDWLVGTQETGATTSSTSPTADAGVPALSSPSSTFRARLCWLSEQSVPVGTRLLLKVGTREVPARIRTTLERFDPQSLTFSASVAQADAAPQLNDIHEVLIDVAEPLCLHPAAQTVGTLSRFLLMHPGTWNTLAAGVVQAGSASPASI